MKQLLILSGKGGTGKTTIASAFIKLANARVYADCDVDAPNLHLIMDHSLDPQREDYYGLPKAEIDLDLCVECDLCRQNCRFEAIHAEPDYKVSYYDCEGCGVCEAICPVEAIVLKTGRCRRINVYVDDTVFSTAQLKMGSGTSGCWLPKLKDR